MLRRNFIKHTALCAVAVSASGFIRFNGNNFEGDCETTTDILGPFYRPDAPLRTDLRIKNAIGQHVVLSGQIKHRDCTTPMKDACVEIWHCDGAGVYDNDSADFKYRAKTYSDDNGHYGFSTIIPVPYEVGAGIIRPAHFHMLFSAKGYQGLVTQLYFTGDTYISTDDSAASPSAKKRILHIANGTSGEKTVKFDVVMPGKLPADTAAIDRLSGVYIDSANKDKQRIFYRKENLLWIKNPESINGGYPLDYKGNNSFEPYGAAHTSFVFQPQTDGSVKLFVASLKKDGTKQSWEAVKTN